MSGALLLAGSGEFLPAMIEVDREALGVYARTPAEGGDPADGGRSGSERVVLDHYGHGALRGARRRGVRGAGDRARHGIENSEHVAALARADLIYLSGGDPGYLVETLRASPAWEAILEVWRRGGTLAGSSAGAMAMGERALVRRRGDPARFPSHWGVGLGLIGNFGVIPHYDRLGPARATPLATGAPPGLLVLGIDEDTVVLRPGGVARVLGRGTVTAWQDGQPTLFRSGEELPEGLVAWP